MFSFLNGLASDKYRFGQKVLLFEVKQQPHVQQFLIFRGHECSANCGEKPVRLS